jgi:hypothetical protein
MSSTRTTANSTRVRAGGLSALGETPSHTSDQSSSSHPDHSSPTNPGGPGGGDGGDGDDDDPGTDSDEPVDDPNRPPHIPLNRWIDMQGLSFAIASAMHSNPPSKPNKGAKPRDPDQFDGSDPAKLDDFLFQCGLVFEYHREAYSRDPDKVLYAIQWLKGTAQRHFRNSFNLPAAEKPYFYENWDAFVTELETNFGELDRSSSAVSQLLALKMQEHHKVVRYKVDFEELAARTPWDTAALRDMFYKGLAERIKDQISGSPSGKAPTLAGLKNQALAFDTRYWERKAEVSHANKSSKSSSSNVNTSSTPQSQPNSSNTTQNSTTHSQRTSRPLDSTSNRQSTSHGNNPSPSTSGRHNSTSNPTRNPSGSNSNPQTTSNRSTLKPNLEGKVDKDGRLTEAEKQRRKAAGLCLYCEQKGHLVADCPARQAKEEAKARRSAAASGSSPQQPSQAAIAKN